MSVEDDDKLLESLLFGPNSDALRDAVAKRAGQRRLVAPLAPLTLRQNVPVAFSCHGKAGEVVPVERVLYNHFRGQEFFATDTSSRPGRATTVTTIVGQVVQFESIHSWVFSEYMGPEERAEAEAAARLLRTEYETPEIRAAAARLRFIETAGRFGWSTVLPGMPIHFDVRFTEDCEWQAVIFGAELRL